MISFMIWYKGQYERELEKASKLDDEARQLIGSILVVIGFLLGAGAIIVLSIHSWQSGLYFIRIVILLMSIVFDYKAIRKRKQIYDPPQIEETISEKVDDISYSQIVQKHILEKLSFG